MRVDVALINDFIRKLDRGSTVHNRKVISFFEALVRANGGKKLSTALTLQRNPRSAGFLDMWMRNCVGWQVSHKEFPQLNMTRTTRTEILEAMIITLIEILSMQKAEHGWATLDALVNLFYKCHRLLLNDANQSQALEYCEDLLVKTCDKITLFLICELEYVERQDAFDIMAVAKNRDFIDSVLLFYTFMVDRHSSLLPLDPARPLRMIQALSICLFQQTPLMYCDEIFWKASVLLPKLAAMNIKSLGELSMKLGNLCQQTHIWRSIDWKSEAVLSMLSDFIQMFSQVEIRPNLKLYLQVLVQIVNKKTNSCDGNPGIPARSNAVFALGHLVQRFHEDLQENEVIDCIITLRTLLKEPVLSEDAVFRENVIGAIARISRHVLEPSSLGEVVPLLHNSMPLTSDVEENIPVLQFWTVWFRTPQVIPTYLPGLLQGLTRLVNLQSPNEKISSLVTDLQKKLQRYYPTEHSLFQQKLKFSDDTCSPVTASASAKSMVYDSTQLDTAL